MTHYVELDVRPILAAGGEPFGRIMEAVASLDPDEGLRLLAPFRPVPLFAALGSKGFTHEDREIGDGDWEVLFTPSVAPAATTPETSSARWPGPLMRLDNRGLTPPEPMVKVPETGAFDTMPTAVISMAVAIIDGG